MKRCVVAGRIVSRVCGTTLCNDWQEKFGRKCPYDSDGACIANVAPPALIIEKYFELCKMDSEKFPTGYLPTVELK